MYGRRATPYEVLTSFSERVGETYATDDVLPRMAQMLGEGAGADAARVWLRVGGSLRPDAAGRPTLPRRTPIAMPERTSRRSTARTRRRCATRVRCWAR